jgi:uncharacterized membrane protein YkvA (DUF1232 family)
MNTVFESESLPLPLPPQYSNSRRQRIAGVYLSEAAIEEFNGILHAVNDDAPRVEADQVISLGRWLQSLPAKTAQATLHQRIARVERLRRMLLDGDWGVSPEFSQRARQLIDYVGRPDDLIHDETPIVGHLDDALLIELGWPALAGEARDYLDYCRFRREHKPRGTPNERRLAWEAECLAEVVRLRQKNEIRQRGYARTEPLTSLRVV